MARALSRPVVRGLLIAIGIVVILAVLRPWTVRPLHVAAPKSFDPASYATEAWPRLLDEANRTAIDGQAAAPDVGQATSPPRAVFMRVTGTVSSIERKSRVGLVLVRLADPAAGEVAIQVGPVIRGTALRDAAGFIRFNDFTNQFQFAAVSNALHDRVLTVVVGRTDLDALRGKRVTVLGATKLPARGSHIEIVPLEITPTGATP